LKHFWHFWLPTLREASYALLGEGLGV